MKKRAQQIARNSHATHINALFNINQLSPSLCITPLHVTENGFRVKLKFHQGLFYIPSGDQISHLAALTCQ